MSNVNSMQYLDVSYDSHESLGLPNLNGGNGGPSLKNTQFWNQDNSLVNLQDQNLQSKSSIERFNPMEQPAASNINVQSHAYVAFDPKNPLNKQPSVGEILDESSFQMI
jgi:hypothetical protein